MRAIGDESNPQGFRINGDWAPTEDTSSIHRERGSKLGTSYFGSPLGRV